MQKQHHYSLINTWTGNSGSGTRTVKAYERSHTVTIGNKPQLHLTTDNKLYGDAGKLNPEDLLVTALSSCHLMSYLYLCALEGVVVMDYLDHATGTMVENNSGGGNFTEVVLHPEVIVADATMIEKAIDLHHKAHSICYIASSVNFPVNCEPVCRAAHS